ncbi:MAG: ADP-ribosylglycohydrolase family protein [Firmicutes bacterium]|nr:ADP-ribosylglycohydrolase family protein [Bacillota bacterium]
MLILDKNIRKMKKTDISKLHDRLNGQFLDVISDILLLSYSKEVMQDLVSVQNTSKENFIEKAKDIIPLNFADSCYEGYLDIYKKKWNYLCFTEDERTGYESISFYKDKVLIIGIAGSDKSVEDWIDNDARLLIPKGNLIPTQFKIVGQRILGIIEEYKQKNNGNMPKEIIITGNSLGGAVTVVAYSEIYHFALLNNIEVSALTYNSAPLRIEYIEDLLLNKNQEYKHLINEVETQKFLDGVINLINEDDLLNNILYIFIKNIENFGHIGKYLIIENMGHLKDLELIHYAKEHINVEPIRFLTVSKVQTLEYHAKNMFEDSAHIIRKSIRGKVIQRVEKYNEAVTILDKIRGGIIGTGIGDYYGNKKIGLTDASKLTMAVAKGLIKEPDDPLISIGEEIIEWHALDRQYIGNTTNIAIKNAIETGSFPTGAKNAHQILNNKTAGSCSLKRCLPIALMYEELDIVITLAGLQSNMTHFDSRVKEACQLYSWLVYNLLKGQSKKQALHDIFSSHLYYGQYKNMKLDEIKGSSYVVETLLNSLALFNITENFDDLINTLAKIENAQEIGSLCGGLTGLYRGLKTIDFKYREQIDIRIELLNIAGNIFDERMKKH